MKVAILTFRCERLMHMSRYSAARNDRSHGLLWLVHLDALHKHQGPPAQLRLNRHQGRTATAQALCLYSPSAQSLPQPPQLLLTRAQSRFWALLLLVNHVFMSGVLCEFGQLYATVYPGSQNRAPSPK